MSRSAFHAFPSTRHLTWLGDAPIRPEKVMSAEETAGFLDGPVVVEEKVDGANLGLSVDAACDLRVQNRGAWIEPPGPAQFSALWPWLEPRRTRLLDALWPDLILFGEWCHATHAIHYDVLPDWFLGFDVYDRAAGRFWSTPRRDRLLAELGLSVVPTLGAGRLSLDAVVGLIGSSRLTEGRMEGVYVRRESNEWLLGRAKVVRADFIQPGVEHWRKQGAGRNSLDWALRRS